MFTNFIFVPRPGDPRSSAITLFVCFRILVFNTYQKFFADVVVYDRNTSISHVPPVVNDSHRRQNSFSVHLQIDYKAYRRLYTRPFKNRSTRFTVLIWGNVRVAGHLVQNAFCFFFFFGPWLKNTDGESKSKRL